MNLFKEILNQISENIHKKSIQREDIVNAISQEVGIKIGVDEVKIKNNSIFLNISPTIKTAIFLKKEKLLKKLSIFGIKTIY